MYAQDLGSGLRYNPETTATERIEDLLHYYGLRKWGFFVYHCTYGDDEGWARSIKYLNQRKDYILKDRYQCHDLADRLDWNVQSDPSLNGASKDEVRRRFRTWVATDARAKGPPQCLTASSR